MAKAKKQQQLTKRGAPRKRAPGAGRKPRAPEERSVRIISVRIYSEDDAVLRALCEKLAITESEVIRRAIGTLARALGVNADKP
jgi:hypothetical protein